MGPNFLKPSLTLVFFRRLHNGWNPYGLMYNSPKVITLRWKQWDPAASEIGWQGSPDLAWLNAFSNYGLEPSRRQVCGDWVPHHPEKNCSLTQRENNLFCCSVLIPITLDEWEQHLDVEMLTFVTGLIWASNQFNWVLQGCPGVIMEPVLAAMHFIKVRGDKAWPKGRTEYW